jgi:ubiquitin-like modifier-activating enzyme ATG7
LLQHKEKEKAPVEEAEFGTTAHQIRGQMSNWQETSLTGSASPYCAGCGDGVVKAYNERGDKFVQEVCQRGGSKVLENVSGLAEAKKGFEDGWDGDDDMDEEDDW